MSIKIVENTFAFGSMSTRSRTTAVVFHHVAGTMTVSAIHNLHKNTNGWAGIGYHFVVDKDGTIYRGRPVDKLGAHVEGHNSYSIGVCLNGDFTKGQPTDAAVNSAKALYDYLCGMYGHLDMKLHKDLAATACPGVLTVDMIKAGKSGTAASGGSSSGGGTTAQAGSGGDTIIKGIQTQLNAKYSAGLAIDGYYGPKTKAGLTKGLQAELNKQYNKNLLADGIWGPKTQNACVTVKKGAQGNITYLLQSMLYCHSHTPGDIDGIFGTKTEAALRAFQQAKGLSVDGIAGPLTFAKFLG